MDLNRFFKELASQKPVPGGGSASCVSAAMATSLLEMVAWLSVGRSNDENIDIQFKEILSEVPPEEGALQEVEEPGLDLPEVEDLLLLEEEDEIVPEDLIAEGEDFPEGPEEFWEPDALDDEDIEEFLPPELRKDRGK